MWSSQAGGQCTHSGEQESTGESRTRGKNIVEGKKQEKGAGVRRKKARPNTRSQQYIAI